MEVILLQRVEKLGQMGAVVSVKPGYARNFLLPQKKAMRASKENLEYFAAKKAQLEAHNLKLRQEAQEVSEKMAGLAVTLVRQAGEAGQLYGSVSARDLAEAVTNAGFSIERSQVELLHPIKSLGKAEVKVVLHPEVTVQVGVNVVRSLEESQAEA